MTLEKSRDEIMIELVKTNDYKAYGKACGTALAQSVALLLLEEELKCQDKKGLYWPGRTALERSRVQITAASVFKLKDADQLKSLIDRLAITLDGEITKLRTQTDRANRRFATVANGTFVRELLRPQRQEPEANYYPAAQAPGENAEHKKALAWLTWGVSGDSSEYGRVFNKHVTGGSGLLLGADDAILNKIWAKLVKDAPEYRLPSLDAPYPSSFAAMHLLRQLLKTHTKVTPPPVGSNAPLWYGHALYWFATIMSLQPFPDGNKRVARAVYALTVSRGGVPFLAPSKAYGTDLARM